MDLHDDVLVAIRQHPVDFALGFDNPNDPDPTEGEPHPEPTTARGRARRAQDRAFVAGQMARRAVLELDAVP